MSSACVVVTTVADGEQAEKIAAAVLDARLAACVQIQGISSHYRWQGRIEKAAEQLMTFKTKAEKYPELERLILALHPYEVPEIICLPVERGSAAYLAWIARETTGEAA